MKYIICLITWRDETILNMMHGLDEVYNGLFEKYISTPDGLKSYLFIDTERKTYSFWNNPVGINAKEIGFMEFCKMEGMI